MMFFQIQTQADERLMADSFSLIGEEFSYSMLHRQVYKYSLMVVEDVHNYFDKNKF